MSCLPWSCCLSAFMNCYNQLQCTQSHVQPCSWPAAVHSRAMQSQSGFGLPIPRAVHFLHRSLCLSAWLEGSISESWDASTASPGFLSVWRALLCHCTYRARYGSLDGQLPGFCRARVVWAHLFPEHCIVSTGPAACLPGWRSLPSCCERRVRCGHLAGQQQAMLRAVQSPCTLSSHIPIALGCIDCFSWFSVCLDVSTQLQCMQSQVWPYSWPPAGRKWPRGFGMVEANVHGVHKALGTACCWPARPRCIAAGRSPLS